MSIGVIGSNPLLFLNPRAQSAGSSNQPFAPSTNGAANSAGPLSILPSSAAVQLSFDNIIALQSLADEEPAHLSEMSATEKFLQEAQKTPAERMRDQILQELGMTEEGLGQLPPDQKRAIEDKIRELIEEKIRQAMNGGDTAPETNAGMIEQLA